MLIYLLLVFHKKFGEIRSVVSSSPSLERFVLLLVQVQVYLLLVFHKKFGEIRSVVSSKSKFVALRSAFFVHVVKFNLLWLGTGLCVFIIHLLWHISYHTSVLTFQLLLLLHCWGL